MDEKQIEGVIPTTLKQAPFKKGGVQTTAQVNFVCFSVLIILNAKIERYVRTEKLVLEQLNRETRYCANDKKKKKKKKKKKNEHSYVLTNWCRIFHIKAAT